MSTTAVDDLGTSRRRRLNRARLYLVCDCAPGSDGDLATVVGTAIAGGVAIVQLRDKDVSDEELTVAATAIRPLCERSGTLLIVNDRPDVAVAAAVDGVHVGQEDIDVDTVRGIVGEEMLIGLSTHTPDQIDHVGRWTHTPGEADDIGLSTHTPGEADDIGLSTHTPGEVDDIGTVDYIGVGPIFRTPTKEGRAAVGVDLVSYAATHARVPFFAIGGINIGNVDEVIAAGAERIAVVRAIAEDDDPEGAASELARRLEVGGGRSR